MNVVFFSGRDEGAWKDSILAGELFKDFIFEGRGVKNTIRAGGGRGEGFVV